MKKPIDIDVDVHKVIEAERSSLEETPNDILRRLLRIDTSMRLQAPVGVEPRERKARRGGSYRVHVLGRETVHASLKEVLKNAVLVVEDQNPGFVEKLSAHRTSRGRRIVARKPEELYPGKPDLVANCAERLNTKWWFDTNISFAQTQRYLRTVSEIAGIKEISLERK